jgi:hypothetical protein
VKFHGPIFISACLQTLKIALYDTAKRRRIWSHVSLLERTQEFGEDANSQMAERESARAWATAPYSTWDDDKLSKLAIAASDKQALRISIYIFNEWWGASIGQPQRTSPNLKSPIASYRVSGSGRNRRKKSLSPGAGRKKNYIALQKRSNFEERVFLFLRLCVCIQLYKYKQITLARVEI